MLETQRPGDRDSEGDCRKAEDQEGTIKTLASKQYLVLPLALTCYQKIQQVAVLQGQVEVPTIGLEH